MLEQIRNAIEDFVAGTQHVDLGNILEELESLGVEDQFAVFALFTAQLELSWAEMRGDPERVAAAEERLAEAEALWRSEDKQAAAEQALGLVLKGAGWAENLKKIRCVKNRLHRALCKLLSDSYDCEFAKEQRERPLQRERPPQLRGVVS
jgi:hypothetical protein